jgi:ABC-2 type transport system ATP-binding protein
MTVSTEKTVEGLDALPGVFDVRSGPLGISFSVDMDKMGAVISHINPFGIKKLDSVPPSLEELFMMHYKKEGVA